MSTVEWNDELGDFEFFDDDGNKVIDEPELPDEPPLYDEKDSEPELTVPVEWIKEESLRNEEVVPPVVSEETEKAIEEIDFEFEAQKLLSTLNFDMEMIELQYNDQGNALQKAKDREAALQREMDIVHRQILDIEGLRFEYTVKKRKIQQDINDADRALKQEIANREAKEKLANLQSTYEYRTRNCPWRTGFKKVVKRRVESTIECPKAMPHQIIGGEAIAAGNGRFLLADKMGIGKTLTVFTGLGMLDEGSKDDNGELIDDGTLPALNILAIVPADSMSDFKKAIERWTYYEPYIIGKMTKEQQKAFLSQYQKFGYQGTVSIINYESWARNKALLSWIKEAGFDAVICDEAHRMKNITTSTRKGVAEIVFAQNFCPGCNTVLSEASEWTCPNRCVQDFGGYMGPVMPVPSVKYVIPMTGTFILNRPQEMYASLNLARPDLFYSHKSFEAQFVDWSGKTWNAGGQSRLAQRISGFYMRRGREDAGIILPKQSVYTHEIEINQDEYAKQYELLEMLRKDAQIKIERGEMAGKSIPVTSLLALITRQRQATVWPGGISINEEVVDETGWPVYDEKNQVVTRRVCIGDEFKESAKIDRALELWQELNEDGHIVMFVSMFRTVLDEIDKRVTALGGRVGRLHGGASDKHVEEVKVNLDRMYTKKEDSKYDTAVVQYLKGGASLNLTAATAIIVMDLQWNDAMEDQALGRIDRLGQTEESQVHILIHSGPQKSIDEWQQALKEFKADMVSGFDKVAKYKTAFEI